MVENYVLLFAFVVPIGMVALLCVLVQLGKSRWLLRDGKQRAAEVAVVVLVLCAGAVLAWGMFNSATP